MSQPALDKQTADVLLATLKKGLASEADLTPSDRAFLRSRQSYISQKHIDMLPSVFDSKAIKEDQKQAEKGKIQLEEQQKVDQDMFEKDPFAPENVDGEDDDDDETDTDLDENGVG